jgi:hypothetical protein
MLEASTNPFAVVAMAHLKTQETQNDAENRYQWKWTFTRRLYELGFRRDDIVQLFKFIDWLMVLPGQLDELYREAFETFEERKNMPYITSIERIGVERGIKIGREEGIEQGIERGIEQGLEQGERKGLLTAIELALEIKFGADGVALVPAVRDVASLADLQQIYIRLIADASLDELRYLTATL